MSAKICPLWDSNPRSRGFRKNLMISRCEIEPEKHKPHALIQLGQRGSLFGREFCIAIISVDARRGEFCTEATASLGLPCRSQGCFRGHRGRDVYNATLMHRQALQFRVTANSTGSLQTLVLESTRMHLRRLGTRKKWLQ